MSQSQAVTRERNYGIDLLRIVSMMMVVTLHVLGHGGVLKGTSMLTVNYEVAWALEILSYCAVNCYALISGYVGVESRFKLTNIILIWLQAAFYSVLLTALCAYLSPDIYMDSVWKAFTPLQNDTYWYFTAYFFVFFFTPFINAAVNSLSSNQLKVIGVLLVLLACILPMFLKNDIFFLNNGYSALWILIMYVLGGIIKKTGFMQKLKWYVLAFLYLLACFITWAEKYFVDYIKSNATHTIDLKSKLDSYTSVTIVLAAIVLLVLFSKMKIGKVSSKIISFFATLTFGVYLIHEMPLIRNMFMKGRFVEYAAMDALKMLGYVALTVVSIFLLCAFIEYLRVLLFRLLHIKQLLQFIEGKTFGKIYK